MSQAVRAFPVGVAGGTTLAVMTTTVRRTCRGQRLPDRIRALLRQRGPMAVEDLAAAICAPGRDAVSRCRRSLEALAGKGLVVRDGDHWRATP